MLNLISDYCSILGFLISVGTFIYAIFIEKRVRGFEKNVLFNTRIPTLTDNLKQHNSQLYKDLGGRNERKIRATLYLCITLIEDISPKLPNDLKKEGNRIKKELKKQYLSNFQFGNVRIAKWKIWIKETTIDNLWESYDFLNAFTTRIDSRQEDKNIIR